MRPGLRCPASCRRLSFLFFMPADDAVSSHGRRHATRLTAEHDAGARCQNHEDPTTGPGAAGLMPAGESPFSRRSWRHNRLRRARPGPGPKSSPPGRGRILRKICTCAFARSQHKRFAAVLARHSRIRAESRRKIHTRADAAIPHPSQASRTRRLPLRATARLARGYGDLNSVLSSQPAASASPSASSAGAAAGDAPRPDRRLSEAVSAPTAHAPAAQHARYAAARAISIRALVLHSLRTGSGGTFRVRASRYPTGVAHVGPALPSRGRGRRALAANAVL